MENKKNILTVILAVVVLAAAGIFLWKKQATPSPQKQAQIMQSIKTLIAKERDCQAAQIKIANLLKTSPDNAEAWYWQGVCEYQLKNYSSAKTSFEHALSLQPGMEQAREYLKLLPQTSKAEYVYKKGVEDQKNFESFLGFTPDASVVGFESVASATVKGTDVSVGRYMNKKTFDQTFAYFKQALGKISGAKVEERNGNFFFVKLEGNKGAYGVFIPKDVTKQLTISYSISQ